MERLKTEGVAHHQQNDKKQNADANTPCASTANESENAINAPRNQKHVENLDSNNPGRLFGEADERLEEFFQRSYELKPIAARNWFSLYFNALAQQFGAFSAGRNSRMGSIPSWTWPSAM